jgi:chromosome partitioning protein
MKIITISNQKGGVGKSTIAVHLAMYLQEAGKRVLFIDLDPQANASKTLNKKAEQLDFLASVLFLENVSPSIADSEAIKLIAADGSMADIERADPSVLNQFKQNIINLNGSFDYCIIDTPPTLGLRMTAALLVADFVLSPIELEEYSIDGITKMLQTVFGVKEKWNPELTFLGMLPNRFNPRSLAQKATLEALMKDYAHLLIPAHIGIRSSIPEALGEGIPVWKHKKTAARVAGREFKKAFEIITNSIQESAHE